MKTLLQIILMSQLSVVTSIYAQKYTHVQASNSAIADNLDLRAVVSIFGEANDLAEFESKLNNPELQISNLDLNLDNEVDYLRVVETQENQVHLVVIQAVLGVDQYQDVASIITEKDKQEKIVVQIIGDPFIYGPHYIYEPIFAVKPPLFSVIWGMNYKPYRSIWFWNNYPGYFIRWHPYPKFQYKKRISFHINFKHQYPRGHNYTNPRFYSFYKGQRNNAYETHYYDRKPNHAHHQNNTRNQANETRSCVGSNKEMSKGKASRNFKHVTKNSYPKKHRSAKNN